MDLASTSTKELRDEMTRLFHMERELREQRQIIGDECQRRYKVEALNREIASLSPEAIHAIISGAAAAAGGDGHAGGVA